MKKSKSLSEAPWVKRSKAESTAKPAKPVRTPEKKRNFSESAEREVRSDDTSHRGRKQAKTLDPRDEYNRKQNEARLQR